MTAMEEKLPAAGEQTPGTASGPTPSSFMQRPQLDRDGASALIAQPAGPETVGSPRRPVNDDRRHEQRAERACANCRFWERAGDPQDVGLCRLNAPTVAWDRGMAQPVTLWPETEEADWCAMWQHDRRGNQPEEGR